MRAIQFFISFLFLFVLASCDSTSPEKNLDDFQPIPLEYAKCFQLFENEKAYKVILLNESDKSEICTFFFPKKNENSHRIAVFSSTAIGYIQQLQKIDWIEGVESTANIYNPSLVEQKERLHTYGNFSVTNVENLYSDKINMVFYSLFTPELPKVGGKFEQLKIQALPLLDWSENHPLGRTEWIKFFGVALGCYEQAVEEYNTIKDAYQSLREDILNNQSSPEVMCGMLLEDIWYMPGGNSYMAHFIKDAGGKYVYEENQTAKSIALTLEQVYKRCAQTPVWINTDVPTKKQMLELYSGYQTFEAFQQGEVYSYTSNFLKYFEESSVRPDLVLKDLSTIFTQGDLSNMYFYQRVK